MSEKIEAKFNNQPAIKDPEREREREKKKVKFYCFI